jgi:hypothetical protein
MQSSYKWIRKFPYLVSTVYIIYDNEIYTHSVDEMLEGSMNYLRLF